jgi:acyl carrier protein phosphodiesterase
MNYLGHLIVLPHQGLVTLGNLLGDFVKGRLELIEPAAFRQGVTLHRAVDRFADQHPCVREAMSLIHPSRRRIAGVLADIFFDHFYALQQPDLQAHAASLAPYIEDLPIDLRPLPQRLITEQWLGSYARIEGIAEVLRRMEAHRQTSLGLTGAEADLIAHYQPLAALAARFLPDVQLFAQTFTKDLRSQSASPAEPPPDAA